MTQELKVFNFMSMSKPACALSIILIVVSFISLAVNGLKLGLDFTGGTQMEVGFDRPADIPKIRNILDEEGLQSPVAILFGSDQEVLIRTQSSMQDGALSRIEAALADLGDDVAIVEVGRASADNERFAHELLISNVQPNQLADIFTESIYGEVNAVASGSDTLVRITNTLDNIYTAHLLSRLSAETDSTADLRRSEFVGPQIGEELRDEGGLGLLCALFMVMLYVAIRFQWKFSVGAVTGLLHDVIIVLGAFSLFDVDFDLTVLAAVLAVIGYSINNTIVIYDRIRDNLRTIRKAESVEIINISLTQTLERTILTSLTTLLTLVMLFLFGGELISGFALALIIGIVAGTYSSFFIASSLLLGLKIAREDLLPPVKEGAEFDAAP